MMGAPRGGTTRLILVRHGEVEAGFRGRIYGRLEAPLSTEGRAQARAVAAAVAGERPVALYASPSLRTRESAAPIAAACALAPVVEPRLQELDFGELEGLTFAEAERRAPATWREWMERPGEVRFPGGETWQEIRSRAVGAAESIVAAHPNGSAVAVTHGGIIRALVAEALGIPADRVFRLEVGYSSLTVLRREPFGWMVEAANRRR